MMPRLVRRDDGTIVLDRLPTWMFEELLLELPDLLAPDQPDNVRRRLFPDPIADDPKAAAEWERQQVPELFALIASAREIVATDLTKTAPPRGIPPRYRLEIPPEHVNAWISGLNAARLTLFERHGLSEEDMAEEAEVTPEVARIHVYGLLQQMLVEITPLS